MPGKPKRAPKKSKTVVEKPEVQDDDLDEMDSDELALIFKSAPFQLHHQKFAEN